jgi:hypothetical protein
VHWAYEWANPPCKGTLPPGSMGFPVIGETFQIFKTSPSIGIPRHYHEHKERWHVILLRFYYLYICFHFSLVWLKINFEWLYKQSLYMHNITVYIYILLSTCKTSMWPSIICHVIIHYTICHHPLDHLFVSLTNFLLLITCICE